MSQTATRYHVREAWPRACELIKLLEPSCTRIWIAGSLRRAFWREPEAANPHAARFYDASTVGDIELVCVPLLRPCDGVLIDDGSRESAVDARVKELCDSGGNYLWMSAGDRKADGPRHKKLVYRGIPIDLWIVIPPADWGVLFTLRTGPQEWSKALVTLRKWGGLCPDDCQVKGGQLWFRGNVTPCPEERDFFAKLGVPFHEPHKRTSDALHDLDRGSFRQRRR